MDPNQTNLSSSTPAAHGGMISFAQLEQLLRLLQPNANLNQTLAAMAIPPQPAATPQTIAAPQIAVAPPATEAVAEVTTPIISTAKPNREMAVERAVTSADVERAAITADAGRIDVEMEVVREEAVQGEDVVEKMEVESERAEVAPDVVREDHEVVRTEMATGPERLVVDSDRVEVDMAEIEEIKKGRGPTIEVGTSGIGAMEEDDFIVISKTEIEERAQSDGETEAQILSASRQRRRLLLEESEEEMEQQREEREAQTVGVSCRRRKILTDEPEEEEEEGENITFQPMSEGPSQRPPVKEYVPRAVMDNLLEKKRKRKQAALPPKKKFKVASSTVRIEEPQVERVATPATNSDDEDARRETRSKQREDLAVPVYPKVHCQID